MAAPPEDADLRALLAERDAQLAESRAELADARAALASSAAELGNLRDLMRLLTRRPTLLDVLGVVVAHSRGQFAHECWQCQYLCRETRFVAGVTQPGSLADMVFHGCRLGGLTKLLEEARARKREVYQGHKGTTQLIRAVMDYDHDYDDDNRLQHTRTSCTSCWHTARMST